jgi:4a-hydroxytetrahydrobiopterin dehydratase
MNQWNRLENPDGTSSLQKDFTFKNFVEAFAAMQKIAFLAEKLNHHPTMTNTYHRLRIELSTHDAGNRITDLDVQLAKEIDDVLK